MREKGFLKKVYRKIGEHIGILGYVLDSRHRKVAYKNVELIYGEQKPSKEKSKLVKDAFKNIGVNLIEFLTDSVPECEIVGKENVEPFIQKGLGIIFVLAHLGNWELLGRVATSRLNVEITTVGRNIKNRLIDKYITKKRKRWNLRVLQKEGSFKELCNKLRKGEHIALLVDQYAGRKGVLAPFLAHLTYTTPAPAFLSLKTGAPIVPVFFVREDDKYKLIVEKPIETEIRGKSTEYREKVYEITRRMNEVISCYILQRPEQWWWVHRRWRGHEGSSKNS